MSLQPYRGQFGAGGGIAANLPDAYGMAAWRPNVFVGDDALDRELSRQRVRFMDREDRVADFDPPAMDLPMLPSQVSQDPVVVPRNVSVSDVSQLASVARSRCHAKR